MRVAVRLCDAFVLRNFSADNPAAGEMEVVD